MDYKALQGEIQTDPLGRGYGAMNDAQILASLTTADRSRNRTEVSGNEIMEACDIAELTALTGDTAVRVWGVIGKDAVDPFGIAAQIFVDAFGGASNTITALAALRVETVSRAQELGLGDLSEQIIQTARTGSW